MGDNKKSLIFDPKTNTLKIKFLSTLLIICCSTLIQAQESYLPIEIGGSIGISVPTTNSMAFIASPEKVLGKLELSYFKTTQQAYITGIHYGQLAQCNELCIPLYYSLRTKPYKALLDPFKSPLGNVINYFVPQQVQIYGGMSNGFLLGESSKNIKINRRYVCSIDIGLKGNYIIGPFRAYIAGGFDFYLTSNYSYRKWGNSRTSPVSYFNINGGISWSY